MKKYSDPEINIISFELTDRTNDGFGFGDGTDPGDPGTGGWEYSVNGVKFWDSTQW